jgi:hypothetical protein
LSSRPQDEKRKTCLASSSSFLHTFLHTWGLADRAAYGVLLGVVRYGLTGNAVLDPCCSCPHRVHVLAPSSPTFALKVSCMGFLPKHGLHLSGRRRCARGIRNSFRHALAAESSQPFALYLSLSSPENAVFGNHCRGGASASPFLFATSYSETRLPHNLFIERVRSWASRDQTPVLRYRCPDADSYSTPKAASAPLMCLKRMKC